MKRLISISGLILTTSLGVLIPAGAQAATSAHHATPAVVQLTSGKPVKATVSKTGQKISYTFAGTAHKHVTFQVTNFNFSDGTNPGSFYLYFYKPGSSSSYTSNYFDDNGWYDFSTPATGTWTVKLVPYSSSKGSMTLTFANDVATKALASGTPVNSTIKFEGQHAGYTFTATANQHVTFQVTQFNFDDGGNPGSFYLYFYKPGSSSSYTSNYFDGNGWYDFNTPLSGTWTVQLVPYDASTGNMILTFADDVATQPLASGTPLTSTIQFEGQHAGYTFTATANKHVTFQVTQFNFDDGGNPGSFYLYFYEPNNTSSYTSNYFDDNGWYDFTPPLSGTWTVQLVPYDASTGGMVLTFANDVAAKALVSGTPVSTIIKFEGQHAGYTFSATSGGSRTFKVSQFNFNDGTNPGSFYLYFYEPNNTSSYTSCYFDGNSSCHFSTPLTGTWSAQLVPYDASTGSMTLTMS